MYSIAIAKPISIILINNIIFIMEKKKFIVYYVDDVNVPSDVYSADTLAMCIQYVDLQLLGMRRVDEEHPCSDSVMNSSRTFRYEIYRGGFIDKCDSEYPSDWVYLEASYVSDTYYVK